MPKIRTLLAEDNPDDVELTLHELKQAGYECEWKRVDRADSFRAAVADEAWDVILSDFTMPKFTAPAALEILKQSGKDIPFIIVSGSVGEPIAVEAMKAGAHDFFPKANLSRLGAAIAREIREAQVRRERQQVVAQLRRAEETYRLIVENVRDYAIFMLDVAGHVASWNQGAERLTQYAEREIVGQPLSTFFPEDERRSGQAEQALRRAAEDGSHLGEGPRLRRDGSSFWALCTLDRIEANGELLGYSAILRDVTERKRLLDDLRQAVRVRDAFLSIASHELKTPLTPLVLQLETLRKLQDADADVLLADPRVSKKLAMIERQAQRLTGLVDNLLDVTRITSGHLELRLAPLDLAELVAHAVERMRERLERAGCSIALDLQRDVVGQWDKARLQTALANLLSNAVKYGAGRPIDICVDADLARARVRIRDHGIGIPQERQVRIFQQFERAVPDQHYGGLGLGLWIVRQVIEEQGGTVHVDSSLGQGSTFTLELPLRTPELGLTGVKTGC